MYSVFIADDERIVLDGIRNKIDWENSEFTFAGEAMDGELALSMIHDVKPDILITDIKMPFMDGLELSRTLKKIQPWIRIIILSGHDEFEYAKEAINIGVEDYILKPFTYEDIIASLKKVAVTLDKERKQISDITQLKAEIENNSDLIKNNFLTEMVLGGGDSAQILQRSGEFGIDLIGRYYKVIVSELHSDEMGQHVYMSSRARLGLLSKNRPDVVSFFISPQRMVSILKSNTIQDLENDSFDFSEAIEHLVELNMNCKVISAIGKNVEHLSEITKSYSDAVQVLNMTRFWSKSRILSSDDVKANEDGMLLLKENDPLVDRLKYAGKNEIDSIIENYLMFLKDNSQSFNVIASYLLVDVIMAVSKLVEDLGGNIKDIMPEILHHSFVENAVANEDVFIREITRMLEKTLDYRDSRMQGRYGDVILKAKDYIEKNYASQDTCLSSVADAVHLSPNHFSTIFSQECGITFIEFLTDVRINKAKKLLKETDMKGADIAYECGFSDPHYFSFIFKKNTGMSPREFKNGETE